MWPALLQVKQSARGLSYPQARPSLNSGPSQALLAYLLPTFLDSGLRTTSYGHATSPLEPEVLSGLLLQQPQVKVKFYLGSSSIQGLKIFLHLFLIIISINISSSSSSTVYSVLFEPIITSKSSQQSEEVRFVIPILLVGFREVESSGPSHIACEW